MNLTIGATTAVKQCMNIQPNETVLIITDENMPIEIGKSLLEASREITDKVKIEYIHPMERSGQEPSSEIAKLMKTPDVLFIPTSKSLSHTKARRDACSGGVRIASMPNIPASSFIDGGLTADYNQVKENCQKMFSKIKNKNNVHLTSPNGTDLTMKIGQYKLDIDNGIYHKPGSFGNLPGGEVCTSPDKGSTNGILVIDKMGIFGENIRIEIKNGVAMKIDGSEKLRETVNKIGNKARNIAELGIGTNPKAKLIGVTLEDEKVYETVHIALGNNVSWGGDSDIDFHDDGIVVRPTLIMDGEILIKDGKWMI